MSVSRPVRRLEIGRLPVDPLSFGAALDAVEALVASGRGGAVFTPNVDHVVLAETDAGFLDAYRRADLCLVDGMILVWAARALGQRLPGKVSGADVVMPLMARARERGFRVYLLGGGPGIAERAAARMERELPGLRVVGTSAPVIDMAAPFATRAPVLDAIRRARADLVLCALGAPKQELFIDEARRHLTAPVYLGIGASLDFIAGAVPRAPVWMSEIGLEWLYRLSREPRRLWRRYLTRDPEFLWLLLRQRFVARDVSPAPIP